MLDRARRARAGQGGRPPPILTRNHGDHVLLFLKYRLQLEAIGHLGTEPRRALGWDIAETIPLLAIYGERVFVVFVARFATQLDRVTGRLHRDVETPVRPVFIVISDADHCDAELMHARSKLRTE